MSGDIASAGAARTERWRGPLLLAAAVLGAIVLVALVFTLGEANRHRDRTDALESHSYEVMILARTLSGTIARAEASLGRYVISGDRELGQVYSAQWTLAGTQIDRLRQETADNTDQRRTITALRAAYDERGAALSDTALSTLYRRNEQALARYYRARKGEVLVRIDRLLDAIIDRERALLRTRTAAATASVDAANRSATVLAVFGALIALGAIALGWTTLAARAEAIAAQRRTEELEDAVATATAELRHEAHERGEAEAKLRQMQKLEAVGQLTGGIAHDFNNMLAVVLGGLELARRNTTAAAAVRHIDNATEGARRAAALTKRLLAFARAEPLLPEAIDPAELIAAMSDLLDRTLGGAIIVETQADGAGWLVWADRHQLENAILNLAVNARDAMDGKGVLTVTTGSATLTAGEVGESAPGDYATIAVTDTGCGIAPELVERVFEPFFTTKPAGKGTGLGLSQIFGFVRQSTGEIGIASAPGAGTTVTLYLPRHAATATPIRTVEAPAAPMVSPGSLAVLVVEDDPRVLAATTGALVELGHHPTGCADPFAAPATLAAMDRVDLILSDVQMPGQTGPEMVASLPAEWETVPVLFVTGYAGELDGRDFCGRGVLRKPFTLAQLERALADAVGHGLPVAAE